MPLPGPATLQLWPPGYGHISLGPNRVPPPRHSFENQSSRIVSKSWWVLKNITLGKAQRRVLWELPAGPSTFLSQTACKQKSFYSSAERCDTLFSQHWRQLTAQWGNPDASEQIIWRGSFLRMKMTLLPVWAILLGGRHRDVVVGGSPFVQGQRPC